MVLFLVLCCGMEISVGIEGRVLWRWGVMCICRKGRGEVEFDCFVFFGRNLLPILKDGDFWNLIEYGVDMLYEFFIYINDLCFFFLS